MDDVYRKKVLGGQMSSLKKTQLESKLQQYRADAKVKVFIKVQKYASLVNNGVEPQEAASRVGIDVPVSKDTRPAQLLVALQSRIR
jgi:hypothetical protein